MSCKSFNASSPMPQTLSICTPCGFCRLPCRCPNQALAIQRRPNSCMMSCISKVFNRFWYTRTHTHKQQTTSKNLQRETNRHLWRHHTSKSCVPSSNRSPMARLVPANSTLQDTNTEPNTAQKQLNCCIRIVVGSCSRSTALTHICIHSLDVRLHQK